MWTMNDSTILRMDRQAYGGDGVGRLEDGRAVFVPFTLPGELVRVKVIEEKARFARAQLEEVLEPSPVRVSPRCRHFGVCGGCHYQHMTYPAQCEVKMGLLGEQLERIGGLRDIPPVEMLPAVEPWNYRNHMQFHLTPQGHLGFQKAGSNETLTIEECHLPEAELNQLWPQIELEANLGLERMNLRQGVPGELLLILEGNGEQLPEFETDIEGLSAVYKGLHGMQVLAGSDHIHMEILEKQLLVSAGSFFQVNRLQASLMVHQIQANLALEAGLTALDVYCGVGLFSAFLAPRVRRLVGIEISPEACEDYAANLDEYDHVELYEAPADRVLKEIDFKPQAIIVDPPREGLGKDTLEGIIAQQAQSLVYVSCDPATLARDARQLSSAGYKLQKLCLIDMFPQTYHIESISFWEQGK